MGTLTMAIDHSIDHLVLHTAIKGMIEHMEKHIQCTVMMINITMWIIVHQMDGRDHLIQERIQRIRGNGRSQANTHEIGRKTAMITSQLRNMDKHIHNREDTSERMEKHTRCIKMKSQRQIGRSLTILREIGRKMIMSQKVTTRIMLQSMNRRSLNGLKMIISQSTAKRIILQRMSQSTNHQSMSHPNMKSQKKEMMMIIMALHTHWV